MRKHYAVALVAAGAVIGGALASSALAEDVDGPKKVTTGEKAKFRVSGYQPNTKLGVTIQERSFVGGNTGAVAVKKRFESNRRGKAKLRFRFPRRYFVCSGANDCDPIRWRDGDRAVISVCAMEELVPIGCAHRTLKIST